MNKATKKPVTIEYVTFEEFVEIGKNAPDATKPYGEIAWSFTFKGYPITLENDECYIIPTLEGNHHFTPNDVLIVGVKGEIYPCKKDIFEMTYDIENATLQGETFEDRLKKEFIELKEKAWKLHDSLYIVNENNINEVFKEKVGQKQHDLLLLQLNCMNSYLYTLGLRLENLDINFRSL